MIFVTVGTHEQPFDRLVRAVDQLKKENRITREVFIQTGYSSYRPEYCRFKDFIGFDEMNEKMAEARIVITHGGTGSVMMVLYHGKIPVVVPRQHKYGEHIDDHQVLFCRAMTSKNKIIPVYDTGQLEELLTGYNQHAAKLKDINTATGISLEERTGEFSLKLNDIVSQLIGKKAK